jgi:hypothetical protein
MHSPDARIFAFAAVTRGDGLRNMRSAASAASANLSFSDDLGAISVELKAAP